MRRRGISVGHSAPRTCSDSRTLKRCMNNVDQDDVVIIDVDSDSVNNVISIDVPESLPRKLRGSNVVRKDKKIPLATIICIDDDESSDNLPGIGVIGDDDFDSNSSSSMGSFPAFNCRQNPLDAVGDGFRFVVENISPVKLSKGKRTYSGKASTRNHYGLSTESESDSSDNDYPDCEFMEDSRGKLREQWEKASLKRKNGFRYSSGRSDVKNPLYTDTYQTTASRQRYENKDGSPFVTRGDGNWGSTSQSLRNPFADTDLKSMPETQFPHGGADFHYQEGPLMDDPLCNDAENQTHRDLGHDGSDFQNEEQIPQCSSVFLNHEQGGDKHVNYGKNFPQDKGKGALENPEPCIDGEASFCKGQCSIEVESNHDMFASRQKEEKFQQTPSSCPLNFPNESKHGNHGFKEKKNSIFSESSFSNIQPCDEAHVNHGAATPKDRVEADPWETFCSHNASLGKSGISNDQDFHQKEVEPVSKESTLCNIHLNEPQLERGITCCMMPKEVFVESMPISQWEDDSLHAQKVNDVPAIQDSIIGEREKLKETDEYKRAVEEEWASRHRQLQIQKEEAHQLRRLRKKKKAESLRLLDMERRQKQRVEEMREIRQKDEENMNLKEVLRAEVRKELSKLEIACCDMASLLRGLGIHVGGGFQPLPHEVRAAYKRALLSFHPDRASKSDIRQQVEAEEKFKLVSLMKEKYLLTS